MALPATLLESHSHVEEVAQTAKLAGVYKLIMIHLNPAYNNERLKEMEQKAQSIFPNSVLASDSKMITV